MHVKYRGCALGISKKRNFKLLKWCLSLFNLMVTERHNVNIEKFPYAKLGPRRENIILIK